MLDMSRRRRTYRCRVSNQVSLSQIRCHYDVIGDRDLRQRWRWYGVSDRSGLSGQPCEAYHKET
jgi:hypothetical protein